MKITSYFGLDPVILLLVSTTVAALIVSIRNYRSQEGLRIFAWYIFFSLLQDLTALVCYNVGFDRFVPLAVYFTITYVFCLVEFGVSIIFILQHVHSKRGRRTIKADAVIFFLLIVTTAVFWRKFYSYVNPPCLESIFLIFPPLVYFHEEISNMRDSTSRDEPTRWIIAGLLIMTASRIPLMYCLAYFGRYYPLVMNFAYIEYIFFFMLLIKAYRYKPVQGRPFFSIFGRVISR